MQELNQISMDLFGYEWMLYALTAYLILVALLKYATNNPVAAIRIVKTLYFFVGFPFIFSYQAIKMIFKLRSSNNFDAKNTETISNRNTNSPENNPASSSKNNRERVDLQYQTKDGHWRTVNTTSSNDDQTIFHGLKGLEGNIALQGTGRIRAVGTDTKKVYQSY